MVPNGTLCEKVESAISSSNWALCSKTAASSGYKPVICGISTSTSWSVYLRSHETNAMSKRVPNAMAKTKLSVIKPSFVAKKPSFFVFFTIKFKNFVQNYNFFCIYPKNSVILQSISVF